MIGFQKVDSFWKFGHVYSGLVLCFAEDFSVEIGDGKSVALGFAVEKLQLYKVFCGIGIESEAHHDFLRRASIQGLARDRKMLHRAGSGFRNVVDINWIQIDVFVVGRVRIGRFVVLEKACYDFAVRLKWDVI